jgi:hypothetical protein
MDRRNLSTQPFRFFVTAFFFGFAFFQRALAALLALALRCFAVIRLALFFPPIAPNFFASASNSVKLVYLVAPLVISKGYFKTIPRVLRTA